MEPDFSKHEDVKEYARMGMRIRKHLQDARAGKVKGEYAGHAVESAETDLFQFRSHTPYRYADQLTADKILAHRDFYSMPDNEVRKEFFHKHKDAKGKKLEGMFAVYFLFIFLGSVFFSYTSLTGSVIAENNGSYIEVYFIIMLFLGILLFFIRKKHIYAIYSKGRSFSNLGLIPRSLLRQILKDRNCWSRSEKFRGNTPQLAVGIAKF